MTDVPDMLSQSPVTVSGPPDPAFEIGSHERLGQRCLRSLARFAAGEVLARFQAASVQDRPSRMTVQVSEREHVELAPTFLSLVNHGCAPNVSFDVERRVLVALAPVAPRDELTFFYPSTEWVMAAPFDCVCGSPRCLGRIAGASQVPARALVGHTLAPHIKRLLAGAWRAQP
jgi:hypothetical protein